MVQAEYIEPFEKQEATTILTLKDFYPNKRGNTYLGILLRLIWLKILLGMALVHVA